MAKMATTPEASKKQLWTLQRLQLDARNWSYLTRNFEHPFKHLVGAAQHVRSACEALGQRWAQGISQCERLFSSA